MSGEKMNFGGFESDDEQAVLDESAAVGASEAGEAEQVGDLAAEAADYEVQSEALSDVRSAVGLLDSLNESGLEDLAKGADMLQDAGILFEMQQRYPDISNLKLASEHAADRLAGDQQAKGVAEECARLGGIYTDIEKEKRLWTA